MRIVAALLSIAFAATAPAPDPLAPTGDMPTVSGDANNLAEVGEFAETFCRDRDAVVHVLIVELNDVGRPTRARWSCRHVERRST